MSSLAERRRADFRHGRAPSPAEPVLERLVAESALRSDLAEFRARHRADEQARISALLMDVLELLSPLVDGDPACDRCAGCSRALSPRRRNCLHCGRHTAPPTPE